MAHICPSSFLLRHGFTNSWQPKGSWVTMLKRVSHHFHNNYKFGPSSLPRLLDVRGMSNLPEKVVYGGPKSQSPWKRITLNHLATKYHKGEPITMVTAYDYPSAVHVDNAGIDICLVGDSVGMVVHGHDTTLPVTLDDMLLHCRAVSRGASRSLLVGDLPFGSYEESKEQVLESALALQDAGCFAIVLECVPSPVAAAITSSLQIPTIGIGAGPNCSGQVLVYHDLLQMTQHPHHAQVTPKFCKAYGNIGIAINEALCKYREEVVSQKFPSAAHTPYRIDQSSVETFISELSKRGLGKAAEAAAAAAENDNKSGEPRISTLPD